MELAGGAAEGEGAGDGEEGAELFEFHVGCGLLCLPRVAGRSGFLPCINGIGWGET
jgi:hypothetical protein